MPSTELGKNPGYVVERRSGGKQDSSGRNGANDSTESVEGNAGDPDIRCEAAHDEEAENEEDDDYENDNEGDDNEDDLCSLQIRIEDEPAWIRLVDGDRLYCSKIDPELCVLFELVPATLATTAVGSLSGDKQQPVDSERTQPADWRLKLPACGSLRLQRTGTNDGRTNVHSAHLYPPATRYDWQQPADLDTTQPADWRLKLPARGSLRLQ
jgi:hypothetical protein